MVNDNEIYRCDRCGTIVEAVRGGGGTLVCCEAPMTLLTENSVDAAREKHVPVIEVGADRVTVRVGSVAHPMEEKHYIAWIELIADGRLYRQALRPGEAPEAVFPVTAQQVTAREYCTLHGHWSAHS